MKASTDRIIGRIMALTLFGASLALMGSAAFAAPRGTHVTYFNYEAERVHPSEGPKSQVVCGIQGCSGNNPASQHIKGGGHGGGGGTITIGE
jgi:hypothetical protein